MPRKYVSKGERNVLDAEKLAKAIKEVMENGASIRNAANAYGINKSSLQRHVKDAAQKLAASTNTNVIEREVKPAKISLGRAPVIGNIHRFANGFLMCFVNVIC